MRCSWDLAVNVFLFFSKGSWLSLCNHDMLHYNKYIYIYIQQFEQQALAEILETRDVWEALL